MESNKENLGTVQGRLDVLRKGIVSEENSVCYYQALVNKTPEDSDVKKGMRRMNYDLMLEEKKHVTCFRELISKWEQKLKDFEANS